MLNRKKRIWEAILIFLGTHLLLFVLLANKSEFVNKLIGDGTPHSPIAFIIIIAASAVLWGYTFRLAGFFCRSTDNTPSTKLFNIQFGIWLMTYILIGSILFFTNNGFSSLSFSHYIGFFLWLINYDICRFACKRFYGMRNQ